LQNKTTQSSCSRTFAAALHASSWATLSAMVSAQRVDFDRDAEPYGPTIGDICCVPVRMRFSRRSAVRRVSEIVVVLWCEAQLKLAPKHVPMPTRKRVATAIIGRSSNGDQRSTASSFTSAASRARDTDFSRGNLKRGDGVHMKINDPPDGVTAPGTSDVCLG
jgi:hypothetical protein